MRLVSALILMAALSLLVCAGYSLGQQSYVLTGCKADGLAQNIDQPWIEYEIITCARGVIILTPIPIEGHSV